MTEIINTFPHCPSAWLLRGYALKKIGYPDLAAGDVHKSMLLANAVLDVETTDVIRKESRVEFGFCLWFYNIALWSAQTLEETQQFIRNKATTILIEAFQVLYGCFHEIGAAFDKFCLTYQHFHNNPGYPQEVMDRLKAISMLTLSSLKNHYEEKIRPARENEVILVEKGLVKARSWPWLTKAHLTRSKRLIRQINHEFREHSGVLRVAASGVRAVLDDGPNVLGVYATEDIKAGTTVLVDRTVLAACNRNSDVLCAHCFKHITGFFTPIDVSDETDRHDSLRPTSGCEKCGTRYCSVRCREAAKASYHQVLCGQDFSWVHKEDQRDTELQAGLLLRTLAVCVQGGTHPLSHPLLARLTASDDRAHRTERWSFTADVATPMRILAQLGIDVFADARFDNWVLRTIQSRLTINKAGVTLDDGARHIVSVKPLMSFFNHSCDPQLEYYDLDGGSAIQVVAVRDVKAGEEMYLTYIGACDGWPLVVRREKLRAWFGGDCRCQRCLLEESTPLEYEVPYDEEEEGDEELEI